MKNTAKQNLIPGANPMASARGFSSWSEAFSQAFPGQIPPQKKPHYSPKDLEDALRRMHATYGHAPVAGQTLPGLSAQLRSLGLQPSSEEAATSGSPWQDGAITVPELCEKRGITEPHGFRVSDLLELEPTIALNALRGLVDNDGRISDGAFYWRDSTQPWAPKITFCLAADTPVRYDEFGNLLNPAERLPDSGIQTACPFDFHAAEVGFVWGKYRTQPLSTAQEGESEPSPSEIIFQPTIAADATDLLCIAYWGGPNSKTRGINQADATELQNTGDISYYEKCSSKHGGAGYDYVILPMAPKLHDAVVLAECIASTTRAQAEGTYWLKQHFIQKIECGNCGLSAEVNEIDDQLGELYGECVNSELAEHSFVQIPQINFCDTEGISPSLQMSLDELAQMTKRQDQLSAQWHNYLAQAKIRVQAWQHFGKQFLQLQPMVCAIYGWMEILGDHATMTLPCQDSDTGKIKYAYVFSDEGVNACLKQITTTQTEAQRLREENQRYRLLLGIMNAAPDSQSSIRSEDGEAGAADTTETATE